MYIRFQIGEKDRTSGVEMGIFMAMDTLHASNSLFEYEIEFGGELYQWFKTNLKVPKVQSAGRGYHARPRAISWFKVSAIEHIQKMREYCQILEAHGIHVQQVTTTRPGDIVYEDDDQIAAVPFRDTFK